VIYNKYIKRFFDILFGIVLLPLVLPMILIIMLIIYLFDSGPVFYKSRRIGMNAKNFYMYKFRSMKMNSPDIRKADGSTYNSENDQRVTKIGKLLRKTSIDEIPQIFNVLKGDMSFIGPRPNLTNDNGYYSKKELERLEVRPGITGYSQAYYRNSISSTEKYINDLYYVNNLSLFLDIKILMKTIISVIMQKNINAR